MPPACRRRGAQRRLETNFSGASYGSDPGAARVASTRSRSGSSERRSNSVLDATFVGLRRHRAPGAMLTFLERGSRIDGSAADPAVADGRMIENRESGQNGAVGTAQGRRVRGEPPCRAYARWFARPCPPNRTCPFPSIRLSTGRALVDRDAGLGIGGLPAGWWPVLFRWSLPTARGCGGRGSGIGSPAPRRASGASCLRGWSSCVPSTVA